jgi:hypothetical protein
VSAGQEPAAEAVVVHEQHQRLRGVLYQRGTGDVSRVELPSGKRRAGMVQQAERKFAGLAGKIVVAGPEGLD